MKKRAAMIIRLTKKQIRLLLSETREKYPVEACGVLFGNMNEEAVVRKIVAARNMLESSTDFQIHPEEFMKTLSEAEKEGMQLIGFFHSHPAVQYPSITDVRYMKLWPENIWIVISSIDYSIGAYQTLNEELRRIRIEIENDR